MSLKHKYDYVVVRNEQFLGLSRSAFDYLLKLEKENEQLKRNKYKIMKYISDNYKIGYLSHLRDEHDLRYANSIIDADKLLHEINKLDWGE